MCGYQLIMQAGLLPMPKFYCDEKNISFSYFVAGLPFQIRQFQVSKVAVGGGGEGGVLCCPKLPQR